MPETTDTATSIGFEPISEKQMAQHLLEYRERMIAHAVRSFKVSPESAEDIFGEVCYKALHYRHKYNPCKGAISSFLYRVMRNHFIDVYREQKARPSIPLYSFDLSEDGSNTIIIEPPVEPESCNFDSNLFIKSIMLLPEPNAKMLQGIIEGNSYEELADKYGISVNAAKGHVFRARHLLANSLVHLGVVEKGEVYRSAYMVKDAEKGNHAIIAHQLKVIKASIELCATNETIALQHVKRGRKPTRTAKQVKEQALANKLRKMKKQEALLVKMQQELNQLKRQLA